MKKPALAAAAFAALVLPTIASAGGPIERACLRSDRQAANVATCNCIQQVADMTLPSGDQRRAAKFFANPDEAQDVRFSSRSSDTAFWKRYKSFGEAAQAYCGG
ncbi:hypothetical protein GQF56_24695 [Rhodobacter sphaeroides]|jgi:hypothetical protein|uniref:Arginine transporter n=2 Tax=Cereibacter sphaeroides TaxID=1063 RepID=Q3J4W5_CERS4|nr:hypothetical protein [Cereibacter sphaeroides]ABN75842.1 hypothetical protein Rsph17029_0729 [Cereibacter sphaeroides ATCC 17029]ABA78169.1 hypothetical protein RSP_2018 [Cereibacter sphaeroides 2.4.1]ACM00182.1 Hypothetical Protein RSKD131_0322 [Cereibacter sphaeroides KD131]AMJ46539.1 hypothetical protein APX01_03020 [Cereibacter sphaeroides]ANS33251.1 hypothetical protein A3858_03025 [Cereibacter sphaeroides]